MDFVKDIHRVGMPMFLFLVLFYVVAGLLFRNGYFQPELLLWMRLLDMPFALVGLVYGVSGLYLQLNQHKSHPTWSAVFIGMAIILFVVVVFLNLAFPTL